MNVLVDQFYKSFSSGIIYEQLKCKLKVLYAKSPVTLWKKIPRNQFYDDYSQSLISFTILKCWNDGMGVGEKWNKTF